MARQRGRGAVPSSARPVYGLRGGLAPGPDVRDLAARLGISRNILTRRLNRLVDNDILTRVPYQDHPPRSEYRLTDKGRDLCVWHVVTAMRQWGDQWSAPKGAPVTMKHTACGHHVSAVAVCSHCGEPLSIGDITPVPGPGASDADLTNTPQAPAPS